MGNYYTGTQGSGTNSTLPGSIVEELNKILYQVLKGGLTYGTPFFYPGLSRSR